MLPKISKTIRFSILAFFLASLTACSGANNLAGRFAANPELGQNSPTPNSSQQTNPTDNFPSEIPRYPNATLQTPEQENTSNQGVTRWTSSDSVKAIESFYQQQLPANQWEIVQDFSPDTQDNTLIAQKEALKIKISQLSSAEATEFTIEYQRSNTPTSSPTNPSPQASINLGSVTDFSDLDQVPEPLRRYVGDLAPLGVLTPEKGDQFAPNATITRREYARWLVAANNALYANSAGKQIHLASNESQPAFSDVPKSDPDFAVIQGLAEAGILPSSLSGDSTLSLFRPNAPLTREDLVSWKVPIDMRKGLPTASIDGIKSTWGFQDATKINPTALRALYGDFQNGEQANVRRVFGYTTLFQPKKPVTRAEAATALWYIGYQGDGISAEEAQQAQKTPETPNSPNPQDTTQK